MSDRRAAILVETLRTALGTDPAGTEWLRLLAEEPDWDALLALAARHRLLPVLGSLIEERAPELPPRPVAEKLKGLVRSNARLGERLGRSLAAALERLGEGDVAALPWGGSAMRLLDPDRGRRRRNWGVEILLDARDARRACHILESAGYRSWHLQGGRPGSGWWRLVEGETFLDPARGLAVRLFWRVPGRETGVSFAFDTIRARAAPADATSGPVLIPHAADLLTAACVRGCVQQWRRYALVYDVAMLKARMPPSGWAPALDTARAAGASRMIRIGLRLAEEVAPALTGERSSGEDAQAGRLADAAWRRLAAPRGTPSEGAAEEGLRYHLGLRERTADRIRFVLAQAFEPSMEDYRLLPLPPALFPAYAFLRPVRLLGDRLFGRRRAGRPETLGPYLGSAADAVRGLLDLAQVGPSDTLFDLGCGDGRIVIAAATERGARGVGIDLDAGLVEAAREQAARAGVQDRVRFEVGDARDLDLSEATVVALYLPPPAILSLREKLERELKPGSRIVAHEVEITGWVPERTDLVPTERGITQLYLWRVGDLGGA